MIQIQQEIFSTQFIVGGFKFPKKREKLNFLLQNKKNVHRNCFWYNKCVLNKNNETKMYMYYLNLRN